MAMTLQEIRARLKEEEDRKNGGFKSSGDGTIYPHWNIPEKVDAVLRFLPDGNPDNGYFWVERLMIKLPFEGVVGQPDRKKVDVQVPCVEMYGRGNVCPIIPEVRTWFNKSAELEEMGKKYWKKKSYLYQGFVRENPLKEDNVPENPIRRFVMSSQIHTLVRAALMNVEIKELPTDYVHGLDFRVKKTIKPGKEKYADYNTSTWSRNESALTDEERAAIDKYGLFNLSDFLPKKPGEVELKVIREMFEASLAGELYDEERWGAYYKPFGLTSKDSNAEVSDVAPTVADPVDESVVDETPVEVTRPTVKTTVGTGQTGAKRAEDILAIIKNRQKQA